MEISNFKADVLETQAELGKMLMIFVISISKLTKAARSDEEVREKYSDSLLVRLHLLSKKMFGSDCMKSGTAAAPSTGIIPSKRKTETMSKK